MKNSFLPLKVCGLARSEDVHLCLELGVAFTGFIFAPGSPRRLSVEAAAALPSGRAARVGVFVDQSPEEIEAAMYAARLDYAQLHGNESEEICRVLGPERVIKTLWPEARDFAKNCARFAPLCAMFLLDSGKSGGGSGRPISLEVLRYFDPGKPWLLAGGLGPENAHEAMSRCVPLAVDCNSALEDAPGIKNHEKIRILVEELEAFRQ